MFSPATNDDVAILRRFSLRYDYVKTTGLCTCAERSRKYTAASKVVSVCVVVWMQ